MGNSQGTMPEADYGIPRKGIKQAAIKDIPKGAIRVSEHEVFKLQDKMMRSWQPSFEMHGLRYGSSYLAGLVALTGIYLNEYWRQAFKLRNKKIIVTFVPTIAIPAFTTMLFNQQLIQKPIQMKTLNCAFCVEMRATALQLLIGVAQPLGLGAFACSYAAKLSHSYVVPPVGQFRDLMHLYRELGARLRTPLLVILLLHIATVAKVTYEQEKGALRLYKKLSSVGFEQP